MTFCSRCNLFEFNRDIHGKPICDGCIEALGYCGCEHCDDSETPCFQDCSEDYCQGCIERALDRDDVAFSIDLARGKI